MPDRECLRSVSEDLTSRTAIDLWIYGYNEQYGRRSLYLSLLLWISVASTGMTGTGLPQQNIFPAKTDSNSIFADFKKSIKHFIHTIFIVTVSSVTAGSCIYQFNSSVYLFFLVCLKANSFWLRSRRLLYEII